MTIPTVNEPASPSLYLPPRPVAEKDQSDGSSPAALAPVDIESLTDWIVSQGFSFEPWQVASFVTAVRTKPFVILAGISGTGKTQLPQLVAEATGGKATVVEVKPSWTDSDELLGYERLDGSWVTGRLLTALNEALESHEQQHFFVLDEMNIARVEYYLAEVLSIIERRHLAEDGTIVSPPVAETASTDLAPCGRPWNQLGWPPNLCLVGSVNMDESTYGFSRKVLDRAFTIEFTEVALDSLVDGDNANAPNTSFWPAKNWAPAALTLPRHPKRQSLIVRAAIDALSQVNNCLGAAQLQVGYRVRDEIAMFCLAAEESRASFRTTAGGEVNPLDLAIAMKVLPRVQGGGNAIRGVVDALINWSTPDQDTGRRGYPFCAQRLDMMHRRLSDAGFTSYWL